MRKVLFLFCFFAGLTFTHAQKFAVKSNLLYDLTSTINLGMEVGLAEKWTLDVSGNYNPWIFGSEEPKTRLKHWMLQPELRYWLCEKFNGHFFGVHGHGGQFNVGGLKFLSGSIKENRYQGSFYGAGVSYGYQWLLNERWSMEAELGVGWAHLDYDTLPCKDCGEKIPGGIRDYVGVTKLSLSLIYFFK